MKIVFTVKSLFPQSFYVDDHNGFWTVWDQVKSNTPNLKRKALYLHEDSTH